MQESVEHVLLPFGIVGLGVGGGRHEPSSIGAPGRGVANWGARIDPSSFVGKG